ncbi:MAG TPA: CehA/McbA family metallohydrolase, partial [Bryobacteraceae bacterium]|nr:CehA/McbA family metallohydrolase [Bryobacteraceae bacterium]
ISNEGGLPQLCLLETYGGAQKKLAIRTRRWKRPMGKLHVRVLDARGKLTPARIQYLASDGKFYPPAEAYARIGLSNRHVFHTPGEFTAELPPGKLTLEAIKGFEYQPAKADVEIAADRIAQVNVTMRRVIDMPAKGWYSGSTHVHMSYGGNLHNSLENLQMVSRAEDQHVLNSLVANKDNRIFDWQNFVPGGGEHPISRNDPNLKVIVGEEYRPPFYGHVFLLGMKDHLISPFTTGYEGTGIESLYPSNTDIFRKATAEGAVVGYVHPWSGDNEPLESNLGVGKGFPVDAALGTIHALEWSHNGHAEMRIWHRALDNDLVYAPTGGEDSITNLHAGKLVGCLRAFVYTGPVFNAHTWMDGIRKGHTFYSSGPLLEFRINGRLPGDVIKLPAGGGTLQIEGAVTSIAPLTKVAIYHAGKEWKTLPLQGAFHEQVTVTESGWYTLYAEGPPSRWLDSTFPQAETNAIRVYVGDQKIRNRESAEYFVRWIDKLHAMADAWPWWRSEAEKKHVFGQFDEARKIYEKLAAEAR